MIKIAVLITAYNRAETTSHSIEALFEQEGINSLFELTVYLVDDGSTDGTATVVRSKFPEVHMLHGDGSLFWGGGTALAYEHAKKSAPDAYLLLNDDTVVMNNALKRATALFIQLAQKNKKRIVVGSTLGNQINSVTYGGKKRTSRWHPFHYETVDPLDEPIRCLTFNGNFVLISEEVVGEIGFIDPVFRHRFGDIDYGLRASAAGAIVYVLAGYIGNCDRNPASLEWDNASRPLRERVKSFSDPKGLPLSQSKEFCKRHGGILWPVFWVLPVIRGIFFPTKAQT